MIVPCPHCQTTYNLPDEKAKVGAKLRCTVCKNVFRLELDDDSQENEQTSLQLDDFDSPKKKKIKNKKQNNKILPVMLLLLLILAISGLWIFTPYLNTVKNIFTPSTAIQVSEIDSTLAERVRLIELRNVRQYNLNNEKIGRISVIEGKVVNGFDKARELIKVEASLYDKDGKVLISKPQLAGTSLSLFQLQVLGEQELEQALANKLDILANNTNIPQGGHVPFMLVFYNPPEEATEFGVKIIDAKPVTQ